MLNAMNSVIPQIGGTVECQPSKEYLFFSLYLLFSICPLDSGKEFYLRHTPTSCKGSRRISLTGETSFRFEISKVKIDHKGIQRASVSKTTINKNKRTKSQRAARLVIPLHSPTTEDLSMQFILVTLLA